MYWTFAAVHLPSAHTCTCTCTCTSTVHVLNMYINNHIKNFCWVLGSTIHLKITHWSIYTSSGSLTCHFPVVSWLYFVAVMSFGFWVEQTLSQGWWLLVWRASRTKVFWGELSTIVTFEVVMLASCQSFLSCSIPCKYEVFRDYSVHKSFLHFQE